MTNQFFDFLPKTAEETKFVHDAFKKEFKNLTIILIVVVATFQTWFQIITECIAFGFKLEWILIRMLYLPYILIVYKIWKASLSSHRFLYLTPMFACYLYIASYLIYFLVKTNEASVSYQLGLAELLVALAFMPIRFRVYIVLYFITLLYVYGGWFIFGSDPALFKRIDVFNYSSMHILGILLFIIVWKSRIDRARLQYRLSIVIAEQSERIHIQSNELARSKIYETVAQTAQLVAHDVRKPFVMIRNGIKLLKTECTSESSQKLFQILRTDIEKSLAKVNSTLKDIMYITSGGKVEEDEVDLVILVNEIIGEIEQIYPNKSFKIETSGFDKPNIISGNQNRINRSIFNIVDNAVGAISENGAIKITLEALDENITLKIINDGPIIPGEKIAKIFDPFFTEGKKSGTGLGLHVTKLFLDEQNAKITCSSDQLNGTVFTITFKKCKK